MRLEAFIVLFLATFAGFRVFRWFTQPTSPSPDPWGPEVEQTLHDSELPALCHRCLTPQDDHSWFCSTCGASVGPYNNYMPFVYVFSQGEVLRAGVTDHIRRSPLTVAGYLLYSVASYAVFAPLYWF